MPDIDTAREHVAKLPHTSIGLYHTPFQQLSNISRTHGVNIFVKCEDMAGPGTISGSKTRLSEFILGRTVKDGHTHVITQGAHLTNSGLQFAAVAQVAELTPSLKSTGVTCCSARSWTWRHTLYGHRDTEGGDVFITSAMKAHRAQLGAAGHRAIIVPTGGAQPLGFVAHLLTFVEMDEQSQPQGVTLDYTYHTAGTGTALPGLAAAKILTGHPVKVRSISICAYKKGAWTGPSMVIDRVKEDLKRSDAKVPPDDVIRTEIDVDKD